MHLRALLPAACPIQVRCLCTGTPPASDSGGGSQVLEECLILPGPTLLPRREQGGTNDPDVRQSMQTPQVSTGTQAEAQCQGQRGGASAARQKTLQTVVKVCLLAGDSLTRYAVDEASGMPSNFLQARHRIRGCHDDDGRQLVGISVVQEAGSLLGWKVGDDAAAATVLGQVGAESLMAHLQHAIVVAHQEYFEIKCTGGTLHEGKIALPVHAGLQSAMVGTDKHRAIGNRFTKRKL